MGKKGNVAAWMLPVFVCVTLLAICAGLLAVPIFQPLNEPIARGTFPIKKQWKFDVDSQIVAEPSVGDGKVIVRTDETLYALDARSGSLLWTTPVHSDVSPTPPLFQDNLVVVGSTSGVKALDAETGQLVWESPGNSCSTGAVVPAAINETMVYVVRNFCDVRAYDRANGTVVWDIDLPGARTGADFFLERDRIYLVVTGEILLVLDPVTGKLIDEVRGQIDGPSTYHQEVLYGFREGENGGDRLVAFDTRAMHTLWVGPAMEVAYPVGPPLVTGQRVIVPVARGHPMAFNIHTGTLLWVAQTDKDMYQTPDVLNDTVYILGIGNGKIHALSIRDGTELGQLYTGNRLVITGHSYAWRPVAIKGLLIIPMGSWVYAYGD